MGVERHDDDDIGVSLRWLAGTSFVGVESIRRGKRVHLFDPMLGEVLCGLPSRASAATLGAVAQFDGDEVCRNCLAILPTARYARRRRAARAHTRRVI